MEQLYSRLQIYLMVMVVLESRTNSYLWVIQIVTLLDSMTHRKQLKQSESPNPLSNLVVTYTQMDQTDRNLSFRLYIGLQLQCSWYHAKSILMTLTQLQSLKITDIIGSLSSTIKFWIGYSISQQYHHCHWRIC